MRFSRSFIHTLYEVPKEAETPSHILLLRGSFIHPLAAGLYSLLPLGHKVIEKIKSVMRDELNSIGGLEITMPVLNPADLWKKTNRYYDIGEELFRFKDRKDRDCVLAMTHEEVVTDLASQFVRSYRDLPVMLYQIQTKIRDEARPRAGLLRVREFFMKDAYSFHPDLQDLDSYYPKIFNAYLRIFARCGLASIPIEADTGIMGGTGSHEFMLDSPNGEDRFVTCTRCSYRANTEKAEGTKPHSPPSDSSALLERVDTPGVKTISDLMGFFGLGEDRFLKAVAYDADGQLVLAVTRGDFSISETKLANRLKSVRLELASEQSLRDRNLHQGFLSPVGVSGVRVLIDTSVEEGVLYIAGGNEVDTHSRNVLPGRDFDAGERHDISEVREGDTCAKCGEGKLQLRRGIELGHTFKLGAKYTSPDSMDVTFLENNGESRRVVMGCYGIGVERLLASVIERWHDESGMIFPVSIAPYQVILSALGRKLEVSDMAESIYNRLSSRFDVLYDDRDESPGVKLKDADLLGIPIRVVVSQKLLKNRQVEIKTRRSGEVQIIQEADLETVLDNILRELEPSMDGLPLMEQKV